MLSGRGTTYGGLDDLAKLSASSLDDGLEVLERLLSLSLDAALDDLHRGGVEGDAARAEEEVAGLDTLRIGPDGSRCLCDHQEEALAPMFRW